MAQRSDIGWTDATWNPVTGCTKLSVGCDHCFASTFAERFRGTPGHYFERGFDIQLRPAKLIEPLRWRKPRLVFATSMSDLFHDEVPDDYIAHCFAVMQSCAAHTFQLLTKRHARMRSLLNSSQFWDAVTDFGIELAATPPSRAQWWADTGRRNMMLPNVWIGISAENQKWADIRIPALMETPAALRFVSAEPLLGPIAPAAFDGVDWIIVGGESGAGHRPIEPGWIRDIRDHCSATDTPFFFKQWGGRTPNANGRELDGRTWDEIPARPNA